MTVEFAPAMNEMATSVVSQLASPRMNLLKREDGHAGDGASDRTL